MMGGFRTFAAVGTNGSKAQKAVIRLSISLQEDHFGY